MKLKIGKSPIKSVICVLRLIIILLVFLNCVICSMCQDSSVKLHSQSNRLGQKLPKKIGLHTKSFETALLSMDENSFSVNEPNCETKDLLDNEPNCEMKDLLDNEPNCEPKDLLDSQPPGWIDPFDMSIKQDQTGWVDPYDMTQEQDQTRWVDPYEAISVKEPSSFHGKTDASDKKWLSIMKRMFKIFLNMDCKNSGSSTSHSIGNPNGFVKCKVQFKTSNLDFNRLKDLSKLINESDSRIDIKMISDILARITYLKTPEEEQRYFDLNYQLLWNKSLKIISKFVSTPEWLIVSSVLIMLISTLWFTHKHSFRMALFTLSITIFAFGFGITWLRMYEEKRAEQYARLKVHGFAPYHCSGQDMAWYEHIYYRFFGSNCEDHYKKINVQPILKVSPTNVLAETISSMIITPAANFGKAYGRFIESVTSSAPWYVKPIATLMGFILPLFFTALLLCFLFTYEVTISPLYFSLKPNFGNQTTINGPSAKDRKYVEDISHKTNVKDASSSSRLIKSLFNDSKQPLFVITNLLGLNSFRPTNVKTSENSVSGQNTELEDESETFAETHTNPSKTTNSSSTKSEPVVYRAIKFSDQMGIEEELLNISLIESST